MYIVFSTTIGTFELRAAETSESCKAANRESVRASSFTHTVVRLCGAT